MWGFGINLFNRIYPPTVERSNLPPDDDGMLVSGEPKEIIYSIIDGTDETEITDMDYINLGIKEGWLEYTYPIILADQIRHRYRLL